MTERLKNSQTEPSSPQTNMNWKEHLRVGILATSSLSIVMAILFGWFSRDAITLLELTVVIIFSGLVPDLDHESGKLHQWMIGLGLLMAVAGFVLDYFALNNSLTFFGVALAASIFFIGEFSKHRGLWHSVPACIVYGVAVGLATTNAQIGMIAFVGCYSHLLADSIPFKMR